MNILTPLSSDEIAELADFLDSDTVPETCLDFVMLDGFLTCVVIGPDLILPSEWMPQVWGDPEGPKFETIEEALHVSELMFRHMNGIAAHFMEGRPGFPPMLQMFHDGGAEEFEAERWCNGFLLAMDLRLEEWTRFLKSREGLLAMPLMTLGTAEGDNDIETSDDPRASRDLFVKHLAPSVTGIHAYWLAKRDGVELPNEMRSSPRRTVKRNVSGSGAKKKPRTRKK
jgi:uncharacterized protein